MGEGGGDPHRGPRRCSLKRRAPTRRVGRLRHRRPAQAHGLCRSRLTGLSAKAPIGDARRTLRSPPCHDRCRCRRPRGPRRAGAGPRARPAGDDRRPVLSLDRLPRARARLGRRPHHRARPRTRRPAAAEGARRAPRPARRRSRRQRPRRRRRRDRDLASERRQLSPSARRPAIASTPASRDSARRAARRGGYRFRTIRPVPYPGRTPHIHVKLRHPAFGEVTSQLSSSASRATRRDFLYRSLAEGDRQEVEMRLQRAPARRRGEVDRRARSARRRVAPARPAPAPSSHRPGCRRRDCRRLSRRRRRRPHRGRGARFQ